MQTHYSSINQALEASENPQAALPIASSFSSSLQINTTLPPTSTSRPSPSSNSMMHSPSFQRHPLLATSQQAHQSLRSIKRASLSSSTLSACSVRSNPIDMDGDRLSPLEAAARRASESRISLHDNDETDADDVEAHLRFPIFARRPSMQTRVRRPSPLRNAAFDLAPDEAISSLDLDEDVGMEEEDDSLAASKDSEDLFRIDDCIEDSKQSKWQPSHDLEDEEDSYGDHAGSLFSIAPSMTSHSTRRTSNHSSAADLDMIWDEEDEDSHSFQFKSMRQASATAAEETSEYPGRGRSVEDKALSNLSPFEEFTEIQHLPNDAVLPFARKSYEPYISQRRSTHLGVPHTSSTFYTTPFSPHARRASNASVDTAKTRTQPTHSINYERLHNQSTGRKRSGTDPTFVPPHLTRHATGRTVRSASTSPRHCDPLEDRFTELLETLRV